MSKIKNMLAAAVLGAIAFTGAAKASSVAITPTVAGYYSVADEGNLGGPSDAIPTQVNGAYPAKGIYVIALNLGTTLSAADSTAGYTGFGNVGFDTGLTGTVTNDSNVPIYVAVLPTINTGTGNMKYQDPIFGTNKGSGIASTGLWNENDDAGTNTSDGKFLVTDIGQLAAFGASDPRTNLTTASQSATATSVLGLPDLIGYAVIDWNTGTGGVFTVNQGTAGEGFSLHNNTTTANTVVQTFGAPNALESFTGGTISFGATPEPASLSMLALGAVGLIRRRRQA